MISVKDLAFLSEAVYDGVGYDGWAVNKFESHIITCLFNHKKKHGDIGFKACIYTKGNEAVVAFSGSDDILDFWSNIQLLTGFAHSQLGDASKYYNRHIASFLNAEITITGHSLGGYLAEFIGNRYLKRTVTFNSPGSNGDIWIYPQISGKEVVYSREVVTKNPAAEGLISHYLCRGDPVSPFGCHMGKMHWIQPEVDYSEYNIDQFFGASNEELFEMTRSEEFETQDYGPGLKAELVRALTVTHSIERWTSDTSLYDGNGDLKPEKEVWVDED